LNPKNLVHVWHLWVTLPVPLGSVPGIVDSIRYETSNSSRDTSTDN